MTRLARLAICVSLGLFAAGAWAVSAAAQVPPSRLQTIEVYRTAQLDADAVKRRYAPAIRELVAGINANDEPTIARLHEEIVESVRASADFAFVALNVTTGFERDENAVYVSIEVVDPADAEDDQRRGAWRARLRSLGGMDRATRRRSVGVSSRPARGAPRHRARRDTER
jgi:hypothetical protein